MPNLEEHIEAFNNYLEGIKEELKKALIARNVEIENDKDKISNLLKCLLSFDPVPVGTIIASYARTPPNGYLLCNGQSITIQTNGETAKYEQLYRCITGETTGDVNGKTFNVPDLRGKFIQGADINNLGKTVDPALPNIKGDLVSVNKIGTGAQAGAFIESTTGSLIKSHNYGSTTPTLSFDASKSNRIYNDKCNTVQPPAVLLNYFIKY